MKPRADKVEHEIGDFVRWRLREDSIGLVVAIIFTPGAIGYRVQWEDSVEEHHGFELAACPAPGGEAV
jgi:hypothetical protein